MEFPLARLIEVNFSKVAAGHGSSLYSWQFVVAAPYVVVLGVAAVVGTFGNLVVITRVTIKHIHSQLYRAETTGNDAGHAFVANLALSDLMVTAVINPLAIAGLCITVNCYSTVLAIVVSCQYEFEQLARLKKHSL